MDQPQPPQTTSSPIGRDDVELIVLRNIALNDKHVTRRELLIGATSALIGASPAIWQIYQESQQAKEVHQITVEVSGNGDNEQRSYFVIATNDGNVTEADIELRAEFTGFNANLIKHFATNADPAALKSHINVNALPRDLGIEIATDIFIITIDQLNPGDTFNVGFWSGLPVISLIVTGIATGYTTVMQYLHDSEDAYSFYNATPEP